MIKLNQLHMSFGDKLLFYDVNLNLNSQTRYALVGANGAGKSTLLKLITGEEEPIGGTINIPKDATLGWLKQDQFRYENTIITDIVLQGKSELWQALEEKEQLLISNEWTEAIAHRLGELEDIIAQLDGYSALPFAQKLLVGLGVHEQYHTQPLKALSGGYKLRVLLAQALFQQPDILLLDEPTNHLDIISIHWLERYLKNEFNGLVLFISHDVAFINRLANYILDIDYGEIRQYSGNYKKFLAEKALIEEQKQQTKQQLESRIAEMQRFVDRFRASPTRARQAQARIKMIDKIELPDIQQSSRVSPHFEFKPARPSRKKILQVQNLSKQFQNKTLFQRINFSINRGEKIALIGENGVGKSTLIKVLLDKTLADNGTFTWEEAVNISYFSQDHHDLLNEHMSVLNWLEQQFAGMPIQKIYQALGQVLFRKDKVEKDILALSGGEAARLLLARMMLNTGNVLILDEPTNHLDIESTEALAHALKNYAGTLLFVSHQREFIAEIANRILFISHEKGLIDYRGNFAEFEQKYDV